MVLIDTSVWIGLFRGRNSELGERMWSLVAGNLAAVCGQVYVEFIGGFRNETLRGECRDLLAGFPFLETTKEAYRLAADLLARYPRLGAGDAVIAATALQHDVPLMTVDRDFVILKPEGLVVVP